MVNREDVFLLPFPEAGFFSAQMVLVPSSACPPEGREMIA